MDKKKKMTKQLNYVALAAIKMTGAGKHPDRKKEASKNACRQTTTTNQGGEFNCGVDFRALVC